MVDKKGYVKTVEAIVAVVLVLLVSFTVVVRNIEEPPTVPSVVSSSQDVIIQTLNLDPEVRDCVSAASAGANDPCVPLTVGDILEANQPRGFDYAFRVCTTPQCICADGSGSEDDCIIPEGLYPADREIYMADTFIGADDDLERNKIVRFWMWQR